MSDFLTVGKILDAEDIRYEPLEVPEWGGKVLLKSLTGEERDRVERMARQFSVGEIAGYSAEIAAMTVCDGNKKLLFSNADLPRLRKKNGEVLRKIFDAVAKQNRLTADSIKEAAKN